MAKMGRHRFLAIAVVFHLVYIYSIFSIYFVSPIVHGMREHHVEGKEAPAKRLVLFVGDGLRADKAFQSFPDPSPSMRDSEEAQVPRPLAPFLRSRVLEHGTFGVSHTRVPTESRPGHVALIAGLYEDVSAVMTGWKLNPVNFDSVFNRSRHTWSWGSPDILPMFEQGAVPGRVYADTYGAEAEDNSKDAWVLDTWVFDKVKALFAEAKTNATLNAELRKEKNVFFLHLLGLDTTGHSHRPYSWQYLHNIQIVDEGVREISKMMEEFYDDGKTAFVFTADHGMSDWGSHGDGHPNNTRTPLIAWGSGVAPPVINKSGIAHGHEDGYSSDWGMDHIQRHDVAQADVAALMAYLVGLAFPTNSVGELPLSYLDTDPKTKAQALLVNAQEILEMYRVKETLKKSTELRFAPFAGLSDETHSVEYRVSQIQKAIDSGDADDAIRQTNDLIQLGIQGLRYLQTYDWLFLRTLVTAGYLGWIAFALTTVIDLHVLHGQSQTVRTVPSMVAFSSVLVVLYAVLLKQQSPWIYYGYAFFPVMFWEEVWARLPAITEGGKVLFAGITSPFETVRLVISTLGFFGLLVILVESYFTREIYTVCYILATAWPVFYGQQFIRRNVYAVLSWVVSCLAMSTFTLLEANKAENLNNILFGGGLMLCVGLLFLLTRAMIDTKPVNGKVIEPEQDVVSSLILGAQTGLVVLAMIVTRSSVITLQKREGLGAGNLYVGWFTLLASFALPVAYPRHANRHYLQRLVVIFLQFAPTFIILTISYEGLFYFAFCMCLFSWMRLEHKVHLFTTNSTDAAALATNPLKPAVAAATERLNAIKQGDYRALTLADARIALFFFFFIQSAFFSASNIASVSSFSLDAVYRLVPIFDPFSQGALLMVKLMVPFAVLSATFGLLNRRLGVAPSALFMVVMAVSDVMTLSFFYKVKDEGSWLDIGTTISHFVIASLLGVFVAGLELASGYIVGGVEFEDGKRGEKASNGQVHAANGNGKAKAH